MKLLHVLVIGASLVLVGCASYRETMRGIGHATGAIEISDVQQANQLQNDLPAYLGLPSNRVRVEAGSGVTHVTIYGATSPSEQQTIATKIQDLETLNPKANPIKLHFEK